MLSHLSVCYRCLVLGVHSNEGGNGFVTTRTVVQQTLLPTLIHEKFYVPVWVEAQARTQAQSQAPPWEMIIIFKNYIPSFFPQNKHCDCRGASTLTPSSSSLLLPPLKLCLSSSEVVGLHQTQLLNLFWTERPTTIVTNRGSSGKSVHCL